MRQAEPHRQGRTTTGDLGKRTTHYPMVSCSPTLPSQPLWLSPLPWGCLPTPNLALFPVYPTLPPVVLFTFWLGFQTPPGATPCSAVTPTPSYHPTAQHYPTIARQTHPTCLPSDWIPITFAHTCPSPLACLPCIALPHTDPSACPSTHYPSWLLPMMGMTTNRKVTHYRRTLLLLPQFCLVTSQFPYLLIVIPLLPFHQLVKNAAEQTLDPLHLLLYYIWAFLIVFAFH